MRFTYARGYNAGLRSRWPQHYPPHPPVEVVSNLMRSLKALRDVIDGELAKLDAGDPLEVVIAPLIENADASLAAVGDWLSKQK